MGIMALVSAACFGIHWWTRPVFVCELVRTRAQRAASDMRSIRTALEAYRVDNGAYPAAAAFEPEVADVVRSIGLLKGGTRLPNCLTTPIAYVTSHFTDVTIREMHLPYLYFTDGESYLLCATGQDKRYQIRHPLGIFNAHRDGDPTLALAAYTYDPTNGKDSAGDLWRFHSPRTIIQSGVR